MRVLDFSDGFSSSSAPTLGALYASDGTVALPGISFANDTDCGFYRIGANNIGLALNGAKVVDFLTTGVNITGNVVQTFATAGSSATHQLAHSDSANAASHSLSKISTGGSSGGDPATHYIISGVRDWITGIDNSDSDKYKISCSSSMGTASSDYFQIDTGGLITIGAAAGTQAHVINGVSVGITNATSVGASVFITCTEASAKSWKIISTGSGDADGVGHLKFYDATGGGAAVMRLSAGTAVFPGTTSFTGTMTCASGSITSTIWNIGAAAGTSSHAVNGTLDILTGTAGGGSVGAIRLSDISTNNTEKQTIISMRAKLAAEENIVLFYGTNFGADTNALYIGGGAGASYNALTNIYFYTAATSTTTGGSLRGSIDQNGLWTIGTSSGTQTHIVNGQSLRLNFGTAGSSAILQARHSDNTTATSHSQIYLETGGGSGGDPKVQYFVAGGQDWAHGIDNSDSDAYVVSNSGNLGTNNAIRIGTDLIVGFPSGVKMKVSKANTSNPPTHDELVSAFGAAATVGVGFMALVDDNNGHTNEYLVWSDGTKYWYLTGTAAP